MNLEKLKKELKKQGSPFFDKDTVEYWQAKIIHFYDVNDRQYACMFIEAITCPGMEEVYKCRVVEYREDNLLKIDTIGDSRLLDEACKIMSNYMSKRGVHP